MQYHLDRINAEISAYSSGDLPKYEYLTKKDLGYKPDAVEEVKFEYSPIGKVFIDGLAKEDKSKKVGLFKRLKNIEDNLVEVDNNDNKVGIFKIIKDIKDRGIKIDNDDEAVREIRERIKELIDEGVKEDKRDIRDKRNRPAILKNNAPFVLCITRINGELIEDADDLDIVMSMYNLLEYSKNYRKL